MHKIKIKPISVNRCWQGRRFKTKEYEYYEQELLLKLPKININKKQKISLSFNFGFSNTNQDIDSSLKPTIDIMQKKYGFNDRNIFQLYVEKFITKKGNEFIEFIFK